MNTPACPLVSTSAPTVESPARKARFFPLRPISARTGLWSAFLGLAAVGPSMALSAFFPLADHSRGAFDSVALAPFAGFLAHVIAGPVIEEIVYRGGLLPLLRRYGSLSVAIGITALLFGAMHFPAGAATMAIATLMGVMLALLSVRGDSLYPSLICHMVFNFTAGFIVGPSFDIAEKIARVPPGASLAGTIGLPVPLWWLAGSVALAVAAVWILRRELVPSRSLR